MSGESTVTSEFRAGQRVRLKSNPTRTGVLSGEKAGNASPKWEVVFPDRTEFVPALAIEVIPDEGSNPYDDMRGLRFGKPRAVRTAITHARLGGKLTDLIYSLYTTNTDFYAYQFKPVLAFLDSPSRGILIADEVGLGKTIEAGLIWTELRSREDAKRLLVLCPAMLREKWQQELADRFGVDARICDAAETARSLEYASGNPRASFAIIASMQGLRGLAVDTEDDENSMAGRLHRIADDGAGTASPLDLVIIDEAHYMRNPETQTARLGALLRRMADNIVLLSATPVHLHNSDLFHLLKLVDADSFPHEWSFDDALRENAPLVELRELLLHGWPDVDAIAAALTQVKASAVGKRSEALQFLLASPLDELALTSVSARLALAESIDRANPITKVVSRTRKRDVHERRVVRKPVALATAMSPVEAEFYEQVTSAVRKYCRKLDISEGFLLTIPQRQLCSSMAAACRAWTRRSADLEDEVDQILWDAFGNDPSFEAGTRKRPDSRSLISELSRIAKDVGDFQALRRQDSKFDALRKQLSEYWDKNATGKVVLFAYFRETLNYLAERFTEIGVGSVVLMGGMDKQAALARFCSPSGPRLLLASEVASEGIDLQFSSLLVNYDLPWNPMRIEQRIGRIDRIGQKAERIVIINVLLADTLDERVYTRLFERLKIFERALGSIEGILGERIREMSFDLLRHDLTAEEESEVIEQTMLAVLQKSRIEEQLEEEAGRLVAHGDYLQHRIASARDLNRYVTSEDLHTYVSDFIDVHSKGAQLVRGGVDERQLWELDLGAVTRAAFAEFLERQRLPLSRLAAPGAGRQVCLFENVLKRGQTDVEVISQYHPLIAFIRSRLEQSDQFRHPVVAALDVDDVRLQGIVNRGEYVFCVSRVSMTGDRVTERLTFAARHLDGEQLEPEQAERLVSTAVMHGIPWLAATGVLDGAVIGNAFELVVDELDARYAAFAAGAERENRDRISFQMQQVERHSAREVQRLQDLIHRLRSEGKMRTIRANEGRIARAREVAAERLARLRERSELRHMQTLVCGGVIKV